MTYLEKLNEDLKWAEAAYDMVDGDNIAPREFYHSLPSKIRQVLTELRDSYKDDLRNTLDDYSKFAMTQGSNFSEYHYQNVIDSFLAKK